MTKIIRISQLFASSVMVFFAVSNGALAEENASNPLAAVNSIELKTQFKTADPGDTTDVFVDGSYMINPRLKLKYELHYIFTDVSGSNEQGLEKLNLKLLYFPTEGELGENWGYRTTVGAELILDLGDKAKGTGIGADQIAPLAGIALSNKETGLTLIPLVQQYISYNGSTDINQTSARLIAIQPFGDANWLKLDAKIPYDWVNKAWPVSAELQLGKNLNDKTAVFFELLGGIGADRPYNYGLGLGLRRNF